MTNYKVHYPVREYFKPYHMYRAQYLGKTQTFYTPQFVTNKYTTISYGNYYDIVIDGNNSRYQYRVSIYSSCTGAFIVLVPYDVNPREYWRLID